MVYFKRAEFWYRTRAPTKPQKIHWCITAIAACSTSRSVTTERLAEAGIEPSVGSRGDSYDNALAESIIGLYKTEVIRRRGPWRGPEDVEFATLEWVHWYNTQRLLEPIGNVAPVEYEMNRARRRRFHTSKPSAKKTRFQSEC